MTLLRIVAPGGGATLQDLGRPGYARYGVPEAGAMDGPALRLANRLVGNEEAEACIEFALTGGGFEVVDGSCRVAVAGGDFDVTVRGRSPGSHRATDLAPGDRLAIGPARSGLYGYLAIAGGFAVAPVLGSRSVHLRSGMGGTALAAGATLPLRRTSAPDGAPLGLDRAFWPRSAGPIRIVWGPQDDLFTEKAKADLLRGPYRATLQSDRMGYRLEGPPVEHAGDFNIVSDGIVLGSIQVPGNRQPIVLLADRQSTGGYPKIATIIGPDIRRLVQRGLQVPFQFVDVSLDEADAILRAEEAAFQDLCARIGPVTSQDLFGSERLLGLNLVDGFVRG